jgi:hypothetical protein
MMPSAVQAPPSAPSARRSAHSEAAIPRRDAGASGDRLNSRFAVIEWCVIAVSIAAGVIFAATWRPDWLANDTAQTLSVARNVAVDGLVNTDVIYYEEHLQFTGSTVPQTVFPPGYPAAIALLMQLGLSDVMAAQVIVTLSFITVPLLIHWLLRSIALQPIWAAAISLLWLGTQPMWWNAQGLQSELPFIACTLGTLICLRRSEASVTYGRWALAAGALTAVACGFRYAGIFFVFSVGVVLAADWLWKRNRITLRRCALFTLLPLSTLAAMFARNASLVGDVKGGNNHQSIKPLADVARTTWYSLSDLFGWSRAGVTSGEVSELLLIAALVFGGSVLLMRVFRHRYQCDLLFEVPHPSSIIPIAYCGISIAGLFWLERTTSVGLCPRLLLPIVPFALLTFGQLVAWSVTEGSLRRVRIMPAALALLAMFAGQIELWATHRQPSIVRDVQSAVDSLSATGINIASLAEGRPVLCNECHAVSNVLRQPVLGLATPNYTSREWNHDSVQELVDRFDVRVVVVFPAVLADGEESTVFFEALLSGDVPGWLIPIVTEGPAHVYQLRRN